MSKHKLPSLSGREVVRAFEKAGYVVARTTGSHQIMKRTGHPTISVPVHAARDMKGPTLRGLIRAAGMTVEEFIRHLT